ncbi:hypothetical protein DRO31_08680 [Candidatus Bathyarchaeota archaeon]|nr:MAG: hypothetical protein DRO31_08680 [Candidatus Bathyarchaeota archaeon]
MNGKTKYLVILSIILLLLASANIGSVTGNDTESDEVIRGYYVWVTDMRTVGDVVLGQNVTIEVDIKYNFLEVPLVPTIIDQNYEIRGKTSDTIQGFGNNTYTISMTTYETDDTAYFAVMAYYFIDGNWTYMDPNGYMAFTLGQGGATSDPDAVELPDSIDFSDIDVEKISNMLNDTIQRGLDIINDVDLPDELSGIPGFPVEALIFGAAVLIMATRRRI